MVLIRFSLIYFDGVKTTERFQIGVVSR